MDTGAEWKYYTIINIPNHAFALLNTELNLNMEHNYESYTSYNFRLCLDMHTMNIWFKTLEDEDFVISTVYRISRIVRSEPNLVFYNNEDDDVETNRIELHPSVALEEALNARAYEYIGSIYVSNIYAVASLLNHNFNTNVFTRRNTGTYTSPDRWYQIKLDHNVIDMYVAMNYPESGYGMLMDRVSSAVREYN